MERKNLDPTDQAMVDLIMQEVRYQYKKGTNVASSSLQRRFRADRILTNNNRPGEFDILLYSPHPNSWITVDHKGQVVQKSSQSLAGRYDRVGYVPSGMLTTNFISSAIIGLAGFNQRYPALYGRSYVARKILGPSPATVQKVLSHGATINTPKAATSASTGPTVMATSSDEISLDDLAEELTSKGQSRAVTKGFSVPKLNPNPYWYESKDDSQLYRDFIDMRTEGHTVNMLIAGPSGSGKTVGVQRLAEELGIPCHIVNCQAITTPEKWLGQMHADISKGTIFVPSQHIEWVERTHADCKGAEKCIILYDEITRLRPELNNMTYSLFDTQRGLEVPQMGRRVMMAPENMIVATANLGAAFTGTHTQDRAFRERFAITLERDFPPRSEEIKILESATGISKADATALVAVADHSRVMWRSGDLDSPISTRTLVAWALFVAGGYTVKKAATYTVLPMFSDDGAASSERAKITSTIEGKVK